MARKMKDSGIEWIGEIPEGWRTINPKALFTQRKDKAQKGERQLTSSQQYGILYQDDYMELTGSKVVTVEKDFDILKHVEAGDFVISMRSFQGGLEYSTKSGAISSAYVMLVPNLELVYPRFYRWLLKSSVYIDALQRTTNMVRDGQAMRYSNFAQVRLFTLPLDEQKSRADFLDLECSSIDKILFKTRSSIEEYKKLKQAVITQAVTKGVRGEREMKDSGVEWIGEIPAEWKIQRFARVAEVKSNLVSPDNYLEYPQVSPENIEKDSGKLLLPCRTVSEVGVISGNHLFYKGQILYSKIRPKLNKVCIAPFDGLCSADMYPIESKNDTRYIVYCILSNGFLQQVSMITENRVKMPKVNQVELSKILVAIPETIAEQKEIADYLDTKCAEIAGLIAKKEQLVKELESYKKSLIYEVVTGKREV